MAPAATGVPEQASNWPTYGGQATSTQYASLDQINLSNINDLDHAWTYHMGKAPEDSGARLLTSYEATPIFNNNRLYFCTPHNNIVALNPATGEEAWRFDANAFEAANFLGPFICRGVAYWEAETEQERDQSCGKRIVFYMNDATLITVDAENGALCTGFGDQGQVALREMDYKGDGMIAATSPPSIYKDVVIVGGTVFDNKQENANDGIVRAFDVRSGKELWNWNPIPAHLSDKVGAANTWAPMSVDQQRGWVFLPTSSPSYDVYGVNRTDPIPHGNAVVALDALSGEKIWSYQLVHHDLWDYDLPAAPTLINVQRNGMTVPAVLQPTKMGFVFLLHRETGEPLFPVEERPVPQTSIPGEYSSPTQPFPLLPAPVASQSLEASEAWGAVILDKMECEKKIGALRNDGFFTPPSLEGSILHPSFLGGSNWGGIAYDQASGLAVVNSSNMVASITLVPREQFDRANYPGKWVEVMDMVGTPYILIREILVSSLGAPCNPPPWGTLTALDMNTGETHWQIPFGQVEFLKLVKTPRSWGSPNQGGPIITKGGLVFIGASLDSKMRAFNLSTGEEVWSGPLPAPAIATPMTFEYGPQKDQYVVITAGGHNRFPTSLSDAVVAFKLKKHPVGTLH